MGGRAGRDSDTYVPPVTLSLSYVRIDWDSFKWGNRSDAINSATLLPL